MKRLDRRATGMYAYIRNLRILLPPAGRNSRACVATTINSKSNWTHHIVCTFLWTWDEKTCYCSRESRMRSYGILRCNVCVSSVGENLSMAHITSKAPAIRAESVNRLLVVIHPTLSNESCMFGLLVLYVKQTGNSKIHHCGTESAKKRRTI